jgi:hypothetical protein
MERKESGLILPESQVRFRKSPFLLELILLVRCNTFSRGIRGFLFSISARVKEKESFFFKDTLSGLVGFCVSYERGTKIWQRP